MLGANKLILIKINPSKNKKTLTIIIDIRIN